MSLLLTGSVLGRPLGPQPLGDLRRPLLDRREAHDRDVVVEADLPTVDLLEEVLSLLDAAELGVVVLDVARRELAHAHDLDALDHRLEDLLARRVLEADGDHHHLAAAVLVRLVAEPDRRGLAAPAKLVDEHRRVEVEHVHGAGAYPDSSTRRRAVSATARSPR